MDKVEIFTDGACKGNPGLGGWGAFLVAEGAEKEICGGTRDTTNNRRTRVFAMLYKAFDYVQFLVK